MKTASVQQLPQQWPEILRWVAAGEEVQVTQQDKVVARVVPARPALQPDFLARAKAVVGMEVVAVDGKGLVPERGMVRQILAAFAAAKAQATRQVIRQRQS